MLSDITLSFGGQTDEVLKGVSLEVSSGEVVALIGDNGAGKSTLVKVAAGLIAPEQGQVNGSASVGLATSDERSLYWRLTVRENLRFFAVVQGVMGGAEAEIQRVCERLDLIEMIDRPYRLLSSGQRARVAMARAIIHQPAVLLLDELTRALDDTSKQIVHRVIAEEAERGCAVLFTSHDSAEVEAVAGRVARLDGGRLSFVDRVEEAER